MTPQAPPPWPAPLSRADLEAFVPTLADLEALQIMPADLPPLQECPGAVTFTGTPTPTPHAISSLGARTE
jgi:hypothetical protein